MTNPMTTIDIRRHAHRAKPGHNLSREGVRRARELGEGHPAPDLVITSPLPRAVQTAVAMGFAVDEEWRALAEMADEVGEIVAWDAGFPAWCAAIRSGGPALAFARIQAALYAECARRLPPGGRGLIISHGGLVEAGAIGAAPGQDLTAFGPHLAPLHGVRLHFDGGGFTRAEILRVP